jgi:hypothetical protein
MSVQVEAGERWTLLQALAWVASRDFGLVEEAGRTDEFVRTDTWLTVAIRNVLGKNVKTSTQWRGLADAIACGKVKATARPALGDAPIADREALTDDAPHLFVDGDRDSIGRGCFLTGESEAQRSWFDVQVDAAGLLEAFPAPGARNSKDRARQGTEAAPGLQQAVLGVVDELWPQGVPVGLHVQSRDDQIRKALKAKGIPAKVGVSTIQRAFRRRR